MYIYLMRKFVLLVKVLYVSEMCVSLLNFSCVNVYICMCVLGTTCICMMIGCSNMCMHGCVKHVYVHASIWIMGENESCIMHVCEGTWYHACM